MDILPTNVSSFRSPSYWNKFYSNPKLNNFEWYLDIKEILENFYKCIEQRDVLSKEGTDLKKSVVVNVGCGNSNLSDVLIKDGFEVVYNLDFSKQVLDEMKKKYNNGSYYVNLDVSKVEYIEFGDMLNEKYGDKYKIIVDKAFLDSYICFDERESVELIKERSKVYLENTFNMMRLGDVFIIISVSQDYVVKELLRNTLMKDLYIDIYPLYDEYNRKAHMIQILYAIYKFDPSKKVERKQCKMLDMPNMPCEYFELGQLPKMIKMAKTTIYLGPSIRNYTPGRRLSFDIFPNNTTDTCFTVVIYDSKTNYAVKTTSCIIVPTGHEHLWLFSSVDGNQELANTTKATRIMLIWLKYLRDHESLNMNPLDSYDDIKVMEYIENNLKESLDNFSLESSSRITIMKMGESAKVLRWVCECVSKYSGKVIVRDVCSEDYLKDKPQLITRQMIFSCNPQVIQSEVTFYESDFGPVFLFNHLSNEYHIAISLSLGFVDSEDPVLILGGGTGVLTSLLSNILDNKIEVVEIDETVLSVGREYFGYTPEFVMEVDQSIGLVDVEYKVLHIRGDALDFVNKTTRKYSAIILDINNIEDMNDYENFNSGFLMSPNPIFLEECVLDRMNQILNEFNGILVLNMLTRCKETREEVLRRLEKKFKFIGIVKTPTDLNEVLICSPQTIEGPPPIFARFASELELSDKLITDVDSWINNFFVHCK